MSITPTSNYMSNTDILGWMETKTDGLYGQMRDEMSGADNNAAAEAALDKIKGDLANSQTNGGDATAIRNEINDALTKYKDIPGVTDVLQPMADKLNADASGNSSAQQAALAQLKQVMATPMPTDLQGISMRMGLINLLQQEAAPKPIKVTSQEADAWGKNISDTLDTLGKTDQLSLIDIQEVNSQLNQAKQTASALMDAADKSATSIIEHIS